MNLGGAPFSPQAGIIAGVFIVMAILDEDGEVKEDVVSDVTGVDIPDVETEVASGSRYARVSVSEVGNDVTGFEC